MSRGQHRWRPGRALSVADLLLRAERSSVPSAMDLRRQRALHRDLAETAAVVEPDAVYAWPLVDRDYPTYSGDLEQAS